jgi:hypothetical protein
VQVQVFDRTVATPTGDNSIVVQYQTANYFQSAAVGLQNRDGTAGLCHVWDLRYPRVSAPLKARTAIRMEPVLLTGVEERDTPYAGRRTLEATPSVVRDRVTLRLSLLTPGPGFPAPVLSIYGADGRLVRVLAGQSPVANRQSPVSIVWDGRDASGVRVAPGLYFVRAGPASTKLTVVR